MTEPKLFPYHQYDTSALPVAMQNALDSAASLCKRYGHTCIGLPHLVLGVLRNCPGLLSQKVSETQREQAEQSLSKNLEKHGGEFTQDLHFVSLPESLHEIITRVFRANAAPDAKIDFVTEVEARLPGQLDHWLKPIAASAQGTPAAKTTPETAPQPTTETARKQTGTEATPRDDGQGKPTAASQARPPFTQPWEPADLIKGPIEAPGRDWEIQTLAMELARQEPTGVIISGPPQCGKTTLIKVLAGQIARGTWGPLEGTRFFSLDILALTSGALAGTIAHAAFLETLSKLAAIPKAVLVVDPAHVFFGLGGPPGFHDLFSCFRGFLLQHSLRMLFVTVPEFLKTISVDTIFNDLPKIALSVPEGADLARVVDLGRIELGQTYGVTIPPDTGKRVIELHEENGRKRVSPATALRTLEACCILTNHQNRKEVTTEDLIQAFSRECKNPESSSPERLRHIEEELSRWVKGQDDAIRAVAPRVRMTRLQLDSNPNRPDGVFLFLGPSGVGKTELAKAVTWSLYGDLTRLVRLDMSEFMGQHEYTKLIGAPPGYIGHGEEGHLTGPVARLGHGVVLLDEAEKAHPSILKMFLQVFDEGFLTDGQGRRVDFSRFVIIMTTNLGRELYAEGKSRLGFLAEASDSESPAPETALQYLLKILPSEFINRVDQVVPFRPLSREHLAEIARKMLDEEAARWLKRDRVLTFGTGIIDFLVDNGYDPRLGARHLARNFERTVSQALSEAFCQEDWNKFHHLLVSLENGKVTLSRK